jgi:hypothetical protein
VSQFLEWEKLMTRLTRITDSLIPSSSLCAVISANVVTQSAGVVLLPLTAFVVQLARAFPQLLSCGNDNANLQFIISLAAHRRDEKSRCRRERFTHSRLIVRADTAPTMTAFLTMTASPLSIFHPFGLFTSLNASRALMRENFVIYETFRVVNDARVDQVASQLLPHVLALVS